MNNANAKNETHRAANLAWLRAGVLGANDGLLSTSSLIVGVAAAQTTPANILLTGVAGLVAGAMSMAAGEYVSVSSQSDTERADLARERHELATEPIGERNELTQIYVGRGLEPTLALQVATQLMARDALKAHARDELGISSRSAARPVQAAMASASMFAIGAALPLLIVVASPTSALIPLVVGGSLVFLAGLGAFAARMGGANVLRGAARVTFWGVLAMGSATVLLRVTLLLAFFIGMSFAIPFAIKKAKSRIFRNSKWKSDRSCCS